MNAQTPVDRRRFATIAGVTAAIGMSGPLWLQRSIAGEAVESTPHASPAASPQATPTGVETVQITITVGDTVLTATMNNSQASRDFLDMLPLTLTLEDYNGTEKISDLPESLSIDDSPEGFDPSPGDLTYYAPWGNLAIFYRDFGYSTGLIHLGTLDDDVANLVRDEPFEAIFELKQ